MTSKLSNTGYTRTAIGLHWIIAIMIACAFIFGSYVSNLPFSPQRLRLISYHKWVGITILLLVLFRLLWRTTHSAPPLPEAIPPWQRFAATAAHGLLYLLMVAVPLSGWSYSSAAGVQVVYLGIIPLPNLIGADKALAHNLKELHEVLNYTLLVVVIAHVLAALKHHFIDKDDILARMLPVIKR